MKQHYTLLLAIFTSLVLSNCANFAPKPILIPNVLLGESKKQEYRDKYAEYHAYYEYDETVIQHNNGSYETYIHKKLIILDEDGVRYGTLDLPYNDEWINAFSVKLRQPSGIFVPIDQFELKRQWRESNKLVIPNVVAGSEITIDMRLLKKQGQYSFEYYFGGHLPIVKNRFTFGYFRNNKFKYKAYGDVDDLSDIYNHKNMYHRIWEINDYIPKEKDAYGNWSPDNNPRISLTLEKYYNNYYWVDLYSDWKKISTYYKPENLIYLTHKEKEFVNQLERRITNNTQSNREYFEQLLYFVQDSITTEYGRNISKQNIIEIYKSRKATDYQKFQFLYSLLMLGGRPYQIIFTRPPTLGGFDEEFPDPQSLMIPILTVNLDNKDYALFPYSDVYPFGEYPYMYYDIKGLNVREAEIVPLPDPPSESFKRKTEFRIKKDEEMGWHYLTKMDFSEVSALEYKYMLKKSNDEDQRETFQDLITDWHDKNNLQRIKFEDLESKNNELTVKYLFTNEEMVISRKRKTNISLQNLFPEKFQSYDVSRETPLEISLPSTSEITIQMKKDKRKRYKVHFKCKDLSNELFNLSCENNSTRKEIKLSYKLEVKNGSVDPEIMREDVYPDILKLNEVRESYITF